MNMPIGELTIGGTTYKNVYLETRAYLDGSPALVLSDDEGEILTATVWLPTAPAQGCVWIKDWSENAGVLLALTEAGVIAPTFRTEPTGFVHASEARLLTGAPA